MLQPTVVIHSAAERRPDVVEKQVEATQALNVSATHFVCQGAGKLIDIAMNNRIFNFKVICARTRLCG